MRTNHIDVAVRKVAIMDNPSYMMTKSVLLHKFKQALIGLNLCLPSMVALDLIQAKVEIS